jgi:lysine-specific demethylase/histidyl-hydroxylase NO66
MTTDQMSTRQSVNTNLGATGSDLPALPADDQRPWLRRCVGATEPFLAESFGRRPSVYPGAPDRFSDLLTLTELDQLLSMGALRSSKLAIVRQGSVMPSHLYTKTTWRRDGASVAVADCGHIVALLRKGGTLIVSNLEQASRGIFLLCDGLSGELFVGTWANAYLTPPASQGFTPHYDDHDVIVVQLHGSKHWMVYGHMEDAQHPSGRVEIELGRRPVLETDLRQGDALYIPRGWAHCAAAVDKLSLHVTVGMRPASVMDFLRYAIKQHQPQGAVLNQILSPGLPTGASDIAQILTKAAQAVAAAFTDPELAVKHAQSFSNAWRCGTERDEPGRIAEMARPGYAWH